MANLAIIPARGGSKRIPRKNIKDFLGKPIVAYSIETALKSNLFDEVMVSTDDAEVAEIAMGYGAKVPFLRSRENADDQAGTMAVLKEVEDQYLRDCGKTFERICCIYPTAPLTQQQHLSEGLELMVRDNLSSVFPAVAFSYPVWRGIEIVHGRSRFIWPEHLNARSQDLKTVYHDAGQWYWYNPLKVTASIFTENTSSIILTDDLVQDIDNLTDWKLAEMKYKLIHG